MLLCIGTTNPYTAAVFPNTPAGQIGQGVCQTQNGYQAGTATSACSSYGIWGTAITPCKAAVPPCPQVIGYQGISNWPATAAGTNATGTCVTGYTAPSTGSPTRTCLSSSTWSTTVINNCIVGTQNADRSCSIPSGLGLAEA